MADKEKADIRVSKLYPGPVDGYEMFHWPEFLAFAKRAGLDLSIPVVSLAFKMDIEELVTFVVEYRAVDMNKVQPAKK